MRLELRGHHVDITVEVRQIVEAKLTKLERFLSGRAVSAQVILRFDKQRHVADITLHARGERFLHGLGESSTWQTAVTQAMTKISHQAQRLKTKLKENRHNLKAPSLEPIEPVATRARSTSSKPAAAPSPLTARRRGPRVLRASREAIKPMSIEDAAREIEAGGDGVVVFRNPESQRISVLYRRPDGELTLVETEP